MSKELKFNMTVETNALLCPNPKEWFAKALLGSQSLDLFRHIPNLKDAGKLGTLDFGSVIQAYGCAFSATDSTLDAIDIVPCKLAIMLQVCQSDLEESYISEWMKSGSNEAMFGPAEFMSYFYDRVAASTKNDLTILTWKGDTSSTLPVIKECDGLEKKLLADALVIDVANTVVTASNVLAEIAKVIVKLPKTISYRKADLVLFVSANVGLAYQIAASTLNVNQYISEAAPLQYQGIKMIVDPGMTDDTMAISLAYNFVYGYDLLGDVDRIDTFSTRLTTGDDYIRMRTNFKFFVGFTNPEEIVYYS